MNIKYFKPLLILLIFCAQIYSTSYAEEYNVGIMMWKNARTYDENMIGLQRGLKEVDLVINQELINANGNSERAIEIFQKFIDTKKDLIIAFGSHGFKLGFKHVKEIPIVVLGGNSPVAYGITQTPKKPGGNMTGSSYFIDPSKQLAYYKKIYPDLKRLGMVFNPENGASLAEVPSTKMVCESMGIEFVESPIERIMIEGKLEGYETFVIKIPPAVEKLVGKVDAIIIPTNSEIYDNIDHVLSVTINHKIPIFSFSKKGVVAGALAGMTSDNEKLGYETANSIKRILVDKENPGDIGFIFDKTPHRIINLKSAKSIDFQIPIFAIKAASEVIR